MAIIVNNQVLAKVIDWLNEKLGLPATDYPFRVSMKELGLEPPTLFARGAGGTISNRSVAGSYDVDFPIEFYYRTTSNSEKDVLTASAVLDTLICESLLDFSQNSVLPPLDDNKIALGFDVNSFSSLVESSEEGELVYSAVINFRYHQGIQI